MANVKWRKRIADLYENQEQGYSIKPEFYPGVADADLILAEKQIGTEFPQQHRSLLLETNGVMEMMAVNDGEWFQSGWLLWPLDKIVEENLHIRADLNNREMYMPLDCFLFFADAGNGDLFAYSILNGKIINPDVFAWGHEDDSRPNIAPSLAQFVEGWKNGTIKI